MKKIFILFTIIIFSTLSCTKESDDFQENNKSDNNLVKRTETLKNGLTLELFDDSTYIFQEDILLTREEAERLVSISDIDPVDLRGLIIDNRNLYWPNGKIPYSFDSDVSSSIRNTVLSAMREWEQHTSIRFVQRTGESKYVRIILLDINDEAGGYSTIGRSSNPQIQLKEGTSHATCLHELGHTIGLVHEHERADRYDHVVIYRDRINPTYLYAFDPSYAIKSLHPFNFESIMIYHSNAFRKTNETRPTMTMVNGNRIYSTYYLTKYDIEIVKQIYDNILYENVLLVRGNIRNQIEYTVTYPIEIGLGNDVIITVKGHVKTGPVLSLKDFQFYNPSNGNLVSSTNNITTGNPNIRVQEFVFRPASRGQLKIYTNEAILGNNYVTINIR